MQEYMLLIWLKRLEGGLKDLGAVQIEELRRLAAGQSGRKLMLPGGRSARCTGSYLVLGPGQEPKPSPGEKVLEVPGETRWGNYRVLTRLMPYKKEIIPENKYTKWMDYDTIKNTIQLRNRKSGDYFIADGGHSKLKKYFIDEKILKEYRDQILLLADGSHILWIVGYRISEACRITDQTKTVLEIQIVEEWENGR